MLWIPSSLTMLSTVIKTMPISPRVLKQWQTFHPRKPIEEEKKITATLRLCINISSLQPRQRPPEDNGQKGTNNAACLLRGVPPNTWLLWFSSPAAINFPDAEYPTIIYPQRNNNAKKRKKKEQTGSRLEKLWYYLSTFLKVIRRTKSNSKILS